MNKKIWWYAVAISLSAFVAFYYYMPRLPFSISLAMRVAVTLWIAFGLYRVAGDLKPAGSFLIGMLMWLVPVDVFHGVMERSPIEGVLATLLVQIAGPLLVLGSIGWGFFLGYRSRSRGDRASPRDP